MNFLRKVGGGLGLSSTRMSAWRDYCSERSLPRVRPRWSGGSRDVREDSPNAGNGLLDATLDEVSFPTANRSRSIPSDPSVAVKGGVVESLQGARPFRTTGSPYGSVSGMRWSRRRTDLTEFSGTTPLPTVECRPSSSHAETISGSDRTLARHSRHAHPANAHLWTGSHGHQIARHIRQRTTIPDTYGRVDAPF